MVFICRLNTTGAAEVKSEGDVSEGIITTMFSVMLYHMITNCSNLFILNFKITQLMNSIAIP